MDILLPSEDNFYTFTHTEYRIPCKYQSPIKQEDVKKTEEDEIYVQYNIRFLMKATTVAMSLQVFSPVKNKKSADIQLYLTIYVNLRIVSLSSTLDLMINVMKYNRICKKVTALHRVKGGHCYN
jgi:hypothetical protein